jgi:sodium/proline symporter
MDATVSVFLVYSLILATISFIAYKRTKTHADYILGGRSLNSPITAMGVAASDMSSWLMLGLPGVVYLFGLNQIWLPISLFIGGYLNWVFTAPRLRVYTEVAGNSLTLPAYLQNRFGEGAAHLRYVAAAVFLVFFTVYAASGFAGSAKTFVSAFGMDYSTALYVTAPIIILYAAIGGYFAINWIDLFQGLLMLFALILIPLIAFNAFHVDDSIFQAIKSIDAGKLNPFHTLTTVGLLSSLAWGLGYFGQPHILVRFMSARDTKAITLGRRICAIWMALSLSGAVFVGLFGVAYFATESLSGHEMVMPELTRLLVHPWVAGIVFAAIISAIMSTVAAVLMAAGSGLVNDFYCQLIRPKASQRELVFAGRASLIALGCLAIFIASDPKSSVFGLVANAWGGLGAAFGPVILVSLYSKKMNKTSALLGMIFGSVTVLSWILLKKQFGGIFELYELLPGFVMGLVGVGLGYLFKPAPAQAQAQFDEMKRVLQLANDPIQHVVKQPSNPL